MAGSVSRSWPYFFKPSLIPGVLPFDHVIVFLHEFSKANPTWSLPHVTILANKKFGVVDQLGHHVAEY